MVPMLTWGLVRSNFFLAISASLLLLLPEPLPRGPSDLRLLRELVGDAGGDLGVVRELHRRGRPTLGHAAQVGDVAEHQCERHERPNDLRPAPVLHAFDVPSPAVEGADDVAHELFGHDDLTRMTGSRIVGSAFSK